MTRGSKLRRVVDAWWELASFYRHGGEVYVFRFQRAGGMPRELLIVVLDNVDGSVKLQRLGQSISMKPERRKRVSDVAHSAQAWIAMMGTHAGFPLVKLL